MQTSEGSLLAGRLRYEQPVAGYRTGLEPVLLAAAVPARQGERVIEAGTGAGAGLLCLAARVASLRLVGIERDAEMAALARRNLSANRAETASVLALPLHEATVTTLVAMLGGLADHAMANPPWHDASGTPSPVAGRAAAKQASPGLLGAWTTALSRLLRPRGTLTLILPAEQFAEAAKALEQAGFGALSLFPLWPRAGAAARLVLVRGIKAARGAASVRAGLVLHDGPALTADAQTILSDGAALAW